MFLTLLGLRNETYIPYRNRLQKGNKMTDELKDHELLLEAESIFEETLEWARDKKIDLDIERKHGVNYITLSRNLPEKDGRAQRLKVDIKI